MTDKTLAETILAAILNTDHRRGWPDPCRAEKGSIQGCTCEVARCYWAAEQAQGVWQMRKRRAALIKREGQR